MEHANIPQVKAEDAKPSTPVLYEMSPNADSEQIVDIKVTGLPSDKTPKILKPSDDLTEVIIFNYHSGMLELASN